jgi:hypothetical protein
MRMAIVGKNPRSGGSECIVFGHVGRDSDQFSPITLAMREQSAKGAELSAFGPWDVRPMRPGEGLPLVPALVAGTSEGAWTRTSGRLVVVSHNWSGALQIDNIGRKYNVDLYSNVTRLTLLDVVNEIMVDVTKLASIENNALKLPQLTPERIAAHILEGEAWFRFLDVDPAYKPSFARRVVERLRARPGRRLRYRLVSALTPKLVALLNAPPPPAPPPADDTWRLREEMRCLAAAVDGLAQRALSEA